MSRKRINKKGLSEAVSIATSMSKKASNIAIDAVTESITGALSCSEEVSIQGLGIFKVMRRKERKGINPATKEEVLYPAKSVVVFKPSKTLKEAVEIGQA